MNKFEILPSPLSVKLLNTEQARAYSTEINEFENDLFGPDFRCPFKTIKPWVTSGCLFHAVISGAVGSSGMPRIFSLASLLITSVSSRNRLFRGEIADYDLTPWTHCPDQSPPVIYFASIVSENREDLQAVYNSLRKDVARYIRSQGIHVMSAFSIAAGSAGMRHLTKSGFVTLRGLKYMDKYNLLHLSKKTAKTRFWDELISEADPDYAAHTAFRIYSSSPSKKDVASAARRLPQAPPLPPRKKKAA